LSPTLCGKRRFISVFTRDSNIYSELDTSILRLQGPNPLLTPLILSSLHGSVLLVLLHIMFLFSKFLNFSHSKSLVIVTKQLKSYYSLNIQYVSFVSIHSNFDLPTGYPSVAGLHQDIQAVLPAGGPVQIRVLGVQGV